MANYSLHEPSPFWQAEVAPEGASIQRIPATTADIRLPVRSLGSLYMGDVSVRRLAAAGMVEVTNLDVLGDIDTAFRAGEAGWSPEV